MKPINPDLSRAFSGASKVVESKAGSIQPLLPKDIFEARASVRSAAPREPVRPRSSIRERAQTKLLRRGALIDKYRIDEVLGMRGFAVVYRATHLVLETPVAIKLLRAEVLAARPGIESQLVSEARFAARINHPNVVRIYDVSNAEDLSYIVMEYIEGAALSKRVTSGGPLAPHDALELGLDVVAGLAAGLAQGLIHRDIKPSNILVSRDGSARIVDFGMAYASEHENWLDSDGSRPVVGTRGYMAPEQAIDSSRVDFRADIYALGVTLDEATSGRAPSSDAAATNAKRLPYRFKQLLAWMQRERVAERPASYDELIAEMTAVRHELAQSDPTVRQRVRP